MAGLLSHFDAIVRAGQIMKNEANFAQEAAARDRFGKPCGPDIKRATQWSIYGIMYHVYQCDALRDVEKGGKKVEYAFQCLAACDLAACRLYRRSIVYVNDFIWRDVMANDTRGYCHERVLECMRLAARRAKNEGVPDGD